MTARRTANFEARLARVQRLVEAARHISDPTSAVGKSTRQRLSTSTGLSPEGIELALARCLESNPSATELEALITGTPEAPHAHVLLSANVFVAAHRAIALALAASANVSVRPSRRESALTELLFSETGDLFALTTELAPKPGEHVFAYGSDATLTQVRRTLPPGTTFHAHGSGIGVVLAELDELTDFREIAAKIALDTALFDQRGCLSPRTILARGSEPQVQDFVDQLRLALDEVEARIPRGELSSGEQADITRYRDSAAFAAEIFPAGKGWLSLSPDTLVPPIGRNLHVARVNAFEPGLSGFAGLVACVGSAVSAQTEQTIRASFPEPRWTEVGKMQTPAFDGPVDLRKPREGEVVL
jgi:hypothetical protein